MPPAMRSFWNRLVGIVTLRRETFEAIRDDPEATRQARLLLLLYALSTAIAWRAFWVPRFLEQWAEESPARQPTLGIPTSPQVTDIVLALIYVAFGWLAWSWLVWLVGTRVTAPSTSDLTAAQMRRLAAWGWAPSLALALGPLPILGWPLAGVGLIWAIVTSIMAVRAAFQISIWRAIATAALAVLAPWSILFGALFVLQLLFLASR